MASNFFYDRSVQHTSSIFRRAFATQHVASPRISRNIIALIIAGNVGVFGAWMFADYKNDRGLKSQLNDRFTLSLRNLKEHRYYTLLTSAFAHREPWHIAFNMLALWNFGQIVAYYGVKGRHTAALCLFTGVASSAAWAYHHAFLKPDDRGRARFGGRVITTKDLDSALGASGMVMGVGAVAACLAPTLPVQLMFIPIPMPLILLVASYAAVDSYFVNSTTSRIGHSAHLGGGVAGVAYYLLFLTRLGGVSSILRRGIR